ncbi:hypothetical protein SDC9_79610 [bioreactor metagenome]|uniref:Uncharacterized protein n=1 Tax=bioreactor metagenome TaxID=1076179 RepID=A0A644Z2T0_9ZZZZ
MKITEDVARALQNCVEGLGSISELSRRTGVRIELLSRFLDRQTKSISQDTWSQIYPLVKPYLNAPGAGNYPKIVGPTARMHHDLVSLTSDEKILLDAFGALPPSAQQKFLAELLAAAEAEVAAKRNN